MLASSPIPILVVDDDPAVLALLRKHLEDAGYPVTTASDGNDAMQRLTADGMPIVVTDWLMPNMDGLALCQAIREHEGLAFTYVILISAQEKSEEHIVAAFHAGVDEFLAKPVGRKELLARVRAGGRIVGLQRALTDRQRELHLVNAEQAVINAKLIEANDRLERLATLDELTGLLNRRAALERLEEAWTAAARHGDPLSCILLDIDHFKRFNDLHGHAIGDFVLRELAATLCKAARKEETVFRFGGEEFLVVCPRTSEKQAAAAAERLRKAVEASVFQTGELQLSVTVSLGIAERTPAISEPAALLRAADDALYAAKDAGRNCVRTSTTLSKASPTPPTIAEFHPSSEALDDGIFGAGEQSRVLVVDDDKFIRTLYRKYLTSAGYEVFEAADGQEALDRVQGISPDVILMDAVMPDMDGLSCIRKLKAQSETRHIPVIMISARCDGTDIAAALSAGADEFLPKPCNPKELAIRVRSMVRLQRQLERSNAVRGEQSRALGLLSDFSRGIAVADSLDEVLDRTLATTASLVCARRVAILLPDEVRGQLVVTRSIGIDEAVSSSLRIPIGGSGLGAVFTSGETLIVSQPDERGSLCEPGDHALLPGVPAIASALATPECVVGVLTIAERHGDRPFTSSELEYLDLIGNIAAAAAHERLTRRARDEARYSIVLALARLAEHRDSDTGKHVDRVTRFCGVLARELRNQAEFRDVVSDEFIADLERAAPLHDIGKVAVPDEILRKPGRLDEPELKCMQTHAAIGARTLRSVIERVPGVTFLRMAEQIAHSHHEWYDGNGYPQRLSGLDIPLAARIAAVADVYDAITTKRVYKDAMPHEEAVRIISGSAGRQFDPDVVAAFLRVENTFARLAKELADGAAADPAPEAVGRVRRQVPALAT